MANNLKKIREKFLAQHVSRMLRLLDQDSTDENLHDTPTRHAKYLMEFLKPEKPFKFTHFENSGYDGMLFMSDIDWFSNCAHHLLPFFGICHIAYIPGESGRIVGLSKLPRCVRHFSRRLQNQERLTIQIAECLSKELKTPHVAVQMVGRHLCMEMRGIESIGSKTVTTTLLGAFKDDSSTRAEYLGQIAAHSSKKI